MNRLLVAARHPCPCQHRLNVRVAVFVRKQNIQPVHLLPTHAPQLFHRERRSIGDDEGAEYDRWVAQPVLDLLDSVVELNLRIGPSQMPNALWVDERHVLAPAFDLPKDKIWVEVAGLEEPNAAAFAQVAQQVQLPGLEVTS